ncbi:MAG: tryptophan synthase subunit alpha [Pseudomonadota bacterium]
MSRITAAFTRAREERRAAFIPFIMAGDPDLETSYRLLTALPDAGADIIELGVAFTDPMADGPAIQAAGLRALKAGQTLDKTLDMVRRFRAEGGETPIVLMGYANPVERRGAQQFPAIAAQAGVDGLIVVDLPPEEDAPLRAGAEAAGIDVIRLATPTTDASRLSVILNGASGFIYYVAVAGVTGAQSAAEAEVAEAVARVKNASDLPVAVGFGVKTPEQAAAFGAVADAVVVGSAIVDRLAAAADGDAGVVENPVRDPDTIVSEVAAFTRRLADAARKPRGAD